MPRNHSPTSPKGTGNASRRQFCQYGKGGGFFHLPDLVMEIGITSFSDVCDYLLYQVSEVWLFRNQ